MPDITGAGWLVEAFFELNTTRGYTMGGPAPIPIDRIWQWQDRFKAPAWLDEAIMKMDARFLDGVRKNAG
jgi:hypothetical protein